MLTIALSFFFLQLCSSGAPFLPVPLSGLTVVVDPGHGGVDPGAHFKRELLEKDLVLDIGRDLAGFLGGAGARVIVTRNSDYDLAPRDMNSLSARKRFDLRERVQLARRNRADILVSLHINSSPSAKKSGAYVYYNDRPGARDIALAVQGELKGLFSSRGCILPGSGLYILRQSPMPAVIVEAGFISNPAERKSLTRAAFRREVAWAVFAGLEKYYQEHGRFAGRPTGVRWQIYHPGERLPAGIALPGQEYKVSIRPGAVLPGRAGFEFGRTGELNAS
ncbi:MAG: N-acetylmuramoyl-L-alanine amidase [Peptococcaceae bacterium]|nr:N-acetylmuramoyl-L-alanine amidase [Peptococcaceae bacterium]